MAYAMANPEHGYIVFNARYPEAVSSSLAHEALHPAYIYLSDDMLMQAEQFTLQRAHDLYDAASNNQTAKWIVNYIADILKRGDRRQIMDLIEHVPLSDTQRQALQRLASEAGILHEGRWDLEAMLTYAVGERNGIYLADYMPEIGEELTVSQAIVNGFDRQLYDDAYKGWQNTPDIAKPNAGVKPGWLPKRLQEQIGNNPLADTAHAAAKINGDIVDLLDNIKLDVAGRWGSGGDAAGITQESYDAMMKWLKDEWIPSLQDMRSQAIRKAQHERDFALNNYADRRNIDVWIHNLAPYFYWSSRTYPKWVVRFVEHPKALSNYLRYRDMMEQRNANLPPWYRQQIQVQLPFMDYPLFMNIEQTLNPVYQLINSFEDRDRSATDTGRLMQQMGDIGAMPWAPLVMSYALSRTAAGHPEQGAALQGYASPVTRAIKAATAAAGVRGGEGVTLEPWMWEGMAEGQPQAFTGMDKWDWRRVPKKVTEMQQAGTITPEEASYTQYKQEGPTWDRAKAMAIGERAPGNLAAFLLGAGFRGRTPSDVEIERADQEWYELSQKVYNPEPGQELSQEEISQLYDDFYTKYPFHAALRQGRAGDVGQWIGTEQPAEAPPAQQRVVPETPPMQQVSGAAGTPPVAPAPPALPEQAVPPQQEEGYWLKSRAERYATDVMYRVPPGKSGYAIRDQYLPASLVDKWYDTDKTFRGWTQGEIDRFMSGIEEMGFAVTIPNAAERAQYENIYEGKQQMDAQLAQTFGSDIATISSGFPFDGTSEEKKQYIRDHPQLPDYWDERRRLIDEMGLSDYYGSDDADNPQRQRAAALFGEKIWDSNDRYFDVKDKYGSVAAKDYLALHPELKNFWSWLSAAKGEVEGGWLRDWVHPARNPWPVTKKKTYGSLGSGWQRGGRNRGGGGYSSSYQSDQFPWWLYPKVPLVPFHWRL